MNYQETYKNYKRPPLSPPPYLFGIVWLVLYVLILISYGYVFRQWFQGDITGLLVLPFIINLVANGAFTYFQFKLKNNFLASLDILIVLITIVLTMAFAWPYYHWVTLMQIPYLAWVTFATYLQFGVTILNRRNKQEAKNV
jgi:benzodiazapine receptor